MENIQQRSNVPLEVRELWVGNDFFLGSTQITGETRLAFNTRCEEGNSVARRKGIVDWGGVGGAGAVYASMVLEQDTNPDMFLRLVDGGGAGVQLQKYNPTNDDWDDIGGNIGGADDRRDWSWTNVFIGGENRVYFTNGVSNLHYTDGTVIAEVDGVKGRYITAKGNVLIIGCMTETHQPNEYLWSMGGTHQFFSTDPDVDYVNTDQKYAVKGVITGLETFNWLTYIFTESDGLYEVDIEGSQIPRLISTHGTMAPKSIAVGADSMIWADQYGVWQLPTNGDVMKISKSVDKMFKCITGSNFFQLTGGINTDEQYELHLGDLEFEGVLYDKVILLYEIEQSRFYGRNIWRIDMDKFHANNIVTWANAFGFLTTFYGARDSQSTYQTNYGHEDNGDPIAMVWQTKDFVLAGDKDEITIEDVYIRYEPLGSGDINIKVHARMDTGAWVQIKDQELPNSPKSHNTIRIQGAMGLTGRAFALRISSTGNLPTKFREVLVTYSYNKSERRL